MLYGITAGLSLLSDGKIEMPCHEALWDASNAEQWRMLADLEGYQSRLNIEDAVSRLINGTQPGNSPDTCLEWSPFACNAAANSITIYISHLIQGTHFLAAFSTNPEVELAQKSLMTTQIATAVSKCLAIIQHARSRADDAYTWDETEGPLLFNSLALLRTSYCRALTRADSVGRTVFFRESSKDFATSIQCYLSRPLERSESVLRAVSLALEGLMIPNRIGSLLVKKTAAFTWAIDHAFASWDASKSFPWTLCLSWYNC